MQSGLKQPGLLAWLHLMRVFSRVQRREAAHLGKYNLTLAQFDVLSRLSVSEGITQQALADQLLVTKGNVCGLIDRLSEQGLVERQADPEDRRANLLFLTPAGRALALQVVPAHQKVLSELMSGLDSDAQRQLLALLRKLDRSLSEANRA
jgi:DNA-binding MarR family transcriptional regulator